VKRIDLQAIGSRTSLVAKFIEQGGEGMSLSARIAELDPS
jgi:hypothetical protein